MRPAPPRVLWLIIGPNGAGKSTYYDTRIRPRLRAEFVNADRIQAEELPGSGVQGSYDAARRAEARRNELLAAGLSFVAETVASHPSKLELLRSAKALGYDIWVTFIYLDTPDLAVQRVHRRVRHGGHPVPEDKIRDRYERMVPIAVSAIQEADRGFVVDNSDSGHPLRQVLVYDRGRLTWNSKDLPDWTQRLFPHTT